MVYMYIYLAWLIFYSCIRWAHVYISNTESVWGTFVSLALWWNYSADVSQSRSFPTLTHPQQLAGTACTEATVGCSLSRWIMEGSWLGTPCCVDGTWRMVSDGRRNGEGIIIRGGGSMVRVASVEGVTEVSVPGAEEAEVERRRSDHRWRRWRWV